MSDIWRDPETAPETSYGTDLREEMKRDMVYDMAAEMSDDDGVLWESPPRHRRKADSMTGRYVITVDGIPHHAFRRSVADLADAKSIARQVATWDRHIGRRVVITDTVPRQRVTRSIFGGERVITETPVVWSIAAQAA
jgi:hypothetical protein